MGHKWLESQVRELLFLWENNYSRLNGNRKNSPVYNEMASKLNKKFFLTLNGSDVNLKIANLKKQYRLEKRKLSIGSSPSCWWVYDLVHKILGCKPVNDSLLSDSIAEVSQESVCSVDVAAPDWKTAIARVAVPDWKSALAGPSGVGNIPEKQVISSDQGFEEEIEELPDIDLNTSHLNSSLGVKEKENHNKRNLDLMCDSEGNEIENENKRKKFRDARSKSKVSASFRALLQYLDGEKAFREKELTIREREVSNREENENKFTTLLDIVHTFIQEKIKYKENDDKTKILDVEDLVSEENSASISSICSTQPSAVVNPSPDNVERVVTPTSLIISSTQTQKNRKKENSVDITEVIMNLVSERLAIKQDDTQDVHGKYFSSKLRLLQGNQRPLAEKLINDVLFEAEMGNLTKDFKIVDCGQQTQSNVNEHQKTNTTSEHNQNLTSSTTT